MKKEDILKWFAIVSAICTFAFWGYNYIGDKSTDELIIKQTTFDSQAQKIKHVNHVNDSPDEADTRELNIEIKRVLEEVKAGEADAVESRANRDARGKRRDSIQDLNNVTIFQLKETMEEQTEINKEILRKLNNN